MARSELKVTAAERHSVVAGGAEFAEAWDCDRSNFNP